MDLTGFDPSTMTYLATQMAHPAGGDNGNAFRDMLMPMDVPDQLSERGYAGYGFTTDITRYLLRYHMKGKTRPANDCSQ